jgi:hypothetical protein
MEFGLLSASARGVVAIRTNLDCHDRRASITLPVFCELREDRHFDRLFAYRQRVSAVTVRSD